MPSTRWDGDDMLAWVRRGMGAPGTTEWPDADLMTLVNRAQVELALMWGDQIGHLEGSEVITTVADVEVYELAAEDILKIRYLSSESFPRLKLKDHEYRLRLGAISSSDPWAWYLAGGQNDGAWNIGLVAPPATSGQSVTVWYTRVPATIETGATVTTSSLPQAYDLPIVQLAVRLGKSLAGQLNEANKQNQHAQESERRAALSLPSSEHVWGIAGFEETHGSRK